MLSATQREESEKLLSEQRSHTTTTKPKTTRLITSLVVLLINPITLFFFAKEANAQMNYQQLAPYQQVAIVCNGLMQLINRYPNELGIRVGVRECNARFYYVRLCMAQTPSVSCWQQLTRSITSEGTEVVERERNQRPGSYLRIGG
jgi:hypothetical protein